MPSWTPLGAVAPTRLTQTAGELHRATRWLERFALALLPPQEDFTHAALTWRRGLQSFVTGSALAKTRGVRLALGLRPTDGRLFFLANDMPGPDLPLHGCTERDVGQWISHCLRAYDLDGDGIAQPKPEANGKALAPPSPEPYDMNSCAAELNELSRYADNAELMLNNAADHASHLEPGPSPVRIWPHHFDTAIYIQLTTSTAEDAPGIGAGLAVPDALYGEFYFYTYPWPRREIAGLPPLTCSGHYQRDGFFGASLPMSLVIEQDDQKACVMTFFEQTIEVFLGALR